MGGKGREGEGEREGRREGVGIEGLQPRHNLRASSVAVLVVGHLHSAVAGHGDVAEMGADIKPYHRHCDA